MRRAIALLVLLANAGAEAAEVSATLDDGKLGARVDALSYPATLPKELTSGLTNRLYARVSLADARATVGQKVVEIAIRYDLWDQKFSVVSTMDGRSPNHALSRACGSECTARGTAAAEIVRSRHVACRAST